MKIKLQVTVLMVIFCIILLLEGVFLYQSNNEVIKSNNVLTEIEIPVLNKAHELKLAVIQVQQWLTDISATRGLDGLNDGFDEAENNAVLFRSLLAELVELDPVRKDLYGSMLPVFNNYYAAGKNMAHAYINGGPAEGNKMMASFDTAAANITKQMEPFLNDVIEQINMSMVQQNKSTETVSTIIIVGFVFLIISLMLLSYVIFSAVIAMSRLPEMVAMISSGDLSATVDSARKDEVGDIMTSLKLLQSKLLEIVSEISDSAQEVTQSSQYLSNISNESNTSIQEQFGEINQIASAMTEMSATVQSVANSVQDTANAANDANQEVNNGQDVVGNTITEINNLASMIDSASNTINQLEQDTDNITNVIGVIRGVAEQTNLLALNAAIEAARAGEQGRGFAVVADEVRTLASRTQTATEEINSMIEKLSLASRNVVQVMKQSQEQTDIAVAKASSTGALLTSITHSVSNINDMCSQIASSAEEQSVVTDEISINIEKINDMSQVNNSNMDKVSQTSDSLNELSMKLESTVNYFKL